MRDALHPVRADARDRESRQTLSLRAAAQQRIGEQRSTRTVDMKSDLQLFGPCIHETGAPAKSRRAVHREARFHLRGVHHLRRIDHHVGTKPNRRRPLDEIRELAVDHDAERVRSRRVVRADRGQHGWRAGHDERRRHNLIARCHRDRAPPQRRRRIDDETRGGANHRSHRETIDTHPKATGLILQNAVT